MFNIQAAQEIKNAILEKLSVYIPYFQSQGLKDRMLIVDRDKTTNPILRDELEEAIADLQSVDQRYADIELFKISEAGDGDNPTHTLVFGKENGKWRCFDNHQIKTASV